MSTAYYREYKGGALMSTRLFGGYKYTTKVVFNYDDYNKLVKIAKRENRRLKKQHRIERVVVYPVPGCMTGMGQLCILR